MRIAAFAFLLTGWGCAGGESRYSDTSRAAETSAAAQTPPTTSPPTTTTPGATTAPGQITWAIASSTAAQRGGHAKPVTNLTPKAPLAPNLTDNEWLNGDGSYQFMVNTITSGVPKPKKYPAAMPPMGGATLTPAQVQSVAAYEYSLSHPMH